MSDRTLDRVELRYSDGAEVILEGCFVDAWEPNLLRARAEAAERDVARLLLTLDAVERYVKGCDGSSLLRFLDTARRITSAPSCGCVDGHEHTCKAAGP